VRRPVRHHPVVARPETSARSQGLALVEFAILLPFLSVLVFGVIDVGRALSAWNEAKGAARGAAFYASTAPYRQQSTGACTDPNNASFHGRAEGGNEFTFEFSPTLPCKSGALTDPERVAVAGETMTVTAVRDFELLTPMMEGILGPFEIRSSVTVRVTK